MANLKNTGITKLFPSGYYQIYCETLKRFLTFDTMTGAKFYLKHSKI